MMCAEQVDGILPAQLSSPLQPAVHSETGPELVPAPFVFCLDPAKKNSADMGQNGGERCKTFSSSLLGLAISPDKGHIHLWASFSM